MSPTACFTASMLTTGQEYRTRLSFSRQQVDTYCELTGDRNAIHRDLAAAQRRFPGVTDIIVPGGLIQSTISGLFGTVFPGDGSLGLTFVPDRMRKPVLPGDEVIVTLTVSRIKGALVDFDIAITDGAGARVSSAQARVMAPDEAYRSWWESQGHAPERDPGQSQA